MRTALVLVPVLVLVGCGARVSPDGAGSGNDQLGGAEADAATDTKPSDPPPTTASDAGPAPDAVVVEPTPTIDVGEIAYIEVDEKASPGPVRIRLDADCRVTDNKGLDSFAQPKNCTETLAIAVTIESYGCGPGGSVGSVNVVLKDGRKYVRDLSADRCSVVIPSVRTHKFMYAAWYSAGGRG